MPLTPERFEAGFELFRELAERGVPALAARLAASRARFFGAAGPAVQDEAGRATERRHLERFLFEESAGTGGGLAVDELLEAWAARAPRDLRDEHAAYLQSVPGIFEVVASAAGAAPRLRELAGLADYDLGEAELGAVFAAGDLVVGRLYPLGDGSHHVSPGAGVFRDPRLVRALEHDLARLREERGHGVLRLSQTELEAMFWERAVAAVPRDDDDQAPTRLAEFLAAGGVAPAQIATWLDALRRQPFPSESLAPGSEDLCGRILEVLAFETELDLERARSLVLAAWRAGAAVPAPAPERVPAERAAGTTPVAEAVADFARDRALGLDLEASLRELERKLGLEDDEDEGDGPAPDFPGVVGAMVEEYLWELGATEGAEAVQRQASLRLFGEFARGLGVFENLSARDVLTFVTFWLPESRRLASGAQAEPLVGALQGFAAWAREAQGVDALDAELDAQLAALRESLPRAIDANALLPRAGDEEGELFHLLACDARGRARVAGVEGEPREVELDPRLAALLRPGDPFRGYTRVDGAFVVACCYPPQAEALRRGRV
ncbi:MAG: hypothetical protein H6828_15470 [Planctomycetes bacterium]|nr:hypothetical protein [Planctomycetota bacterium]